MNLELPIKLPARRPLLTISTVSTLLDRDPRDVMECCEEGTLAWSWDLATPGASRREVRIWRGAVVAWLQSNGADGAARANEHHVYADILPQACTSSSIVKRRLAVSRDLLASLIQCGDLPVSVIAATDRGINAACKLSHDGLVHFLKKRRI